MSNLIIFFTSIWSYRIVRIILGMMFLVAGAIKMMDPQQFGIVIDAFGLVPRPLVMPVAYTMLLLEMVAGAGLILDRRGSLPTIAVLTCLFLIVLGYGLHLGLDIDCGCYGPGDPEGEAFSSLRESFYRDLWILAGVMYCYWWRWNARRGQCNPSSISNVIIEENVNA